MPAVCRRYAGDNWYIFRMEILAPQMTMANVMMFLSALCRATGKAVGRACLRV
ncbi:hypothetical protein [Gabonibacter massiliensis]|uniref:hypothetical protein n=1 Tax=Gabonibacter massiliensis TaxID=1720195 RepID=UPI0012B587FD|nr:hypothetical protein [Gabonibacter massiliensis]